ncbi:unnamed protein product [Penicillium egyptiacum]|uniref:Zn(2)-C6 fungal-type domain-containing protein n=1 Tax=Penicillium egyptiacum TaxID=1303716 RepID=A0A9W4K8J9_9EURO|nr:unnamed protein product [Penicillium egyptiacum]
MNEDMVVSAASDRADNPRVRRHRARHTKSRNGCYPCKFRRVKVRLVIPSLVGFRFQPNSDFVKCDELQPACGTCSSRGEPCSYPPPRVTSRKPPRSRADTEKDGGLPGPFEPSDEGPLLGRIQPLSINVTAPTITSNQSHQHRHGDLEMNDLKLLQFYHLHTGRQMSLHQRRSNVWQQIMPELASKSRYLMHLLLALGGMHMIKQKADDSGTVVESSDTVDLGIIMEHHQRGLEGFREEVSRISPSNAESVFTGSLLLVAFAFAFLRVQDLNPVTGAAEEMSSAMPDPSLTNEIPRLNWLYLNRGVNSVIGDQWPVLKTSRLRQILILPHTDLSWDDLSSGAPSRLSRCSPRLLKFAQGARHAVASIKASLDALEANWDGLSSRSGTPTSQPSPSATLDWAIDAHNEAIDILDSVYSRILSVLRCAATEDSTHKEIQVDFEEAAILSWPVFLPSAFLASLERSDRDFLHGHSLVILAHLYLVNTLVDTWYMRGSFENEILRLNALIGSLNGNELPAFMLWPNEVLSLPLTCTS